MAVDLDKLRELQKLYEESKTAPPDAMVPDDVLGQVRANDRTYHYCNFSSALHGGREGLIAIAEAAEKWRDVTCDRLSGCEYGDHDHECGMLKADRELFAVVVEHLGPRKEAP